MARRKTTKEEPKILEIDGIPTAQGLVAMGRKYAQPTPKGIHITPEGHALIGQALRNLAKESIENGTWHGTSGKHSGKPRQPGL